MAVRFDYPQNGWSNGKMRKRGDTQVAMDVRRGRPELEEPGIAEAEKLAGASAALSARGGPVGAGAAMLDPQVRATKQQKDIAATAKSAALQALSDKDLQQAIDDHLAEQARRKNGVTAEAQ